MDVEMLKRLFKLYDEPKADFGVMPMTISWLGNSSVATVPTIYDLVVKGRMEGHKFGKGDYAVFVSVGAGMNINAFAYKEI
jgi:3-oxoacyl-[acyl-carrier-protein] synthase-3